MRIKYDARSAKARKEISNIITSSVLQVEIDTKNLGKQLKAIEEAGFDFCGSFEEYEKEVAKILSE